MSLPSLRPVPVASERPVVADVKAVEQAVVDRVLGLPPAVPPHTGLRYIPVAGTHGWFDAWTTADSPFGLMMTAEGFNVSRAGERAYRWSGAIDGLLGDDRDWEAAADSLYYFSRDLAYADLNFIAHSHGGQLVLLLAASGFPIRTLTTVGTPPREGAQFARAEQFIGFHQHIYDLKRDFWGWLGQVGPKQLRMERAYADPRVTNIGIANISHAKVLRDPKHIPLWQTKGWLEAIRRAPLTPEPSVVVPLEKLI